MPFNTLTKVSKVCDISIEDVEEKWKKAKKVASESTREDSDLFFRLTMSIFQKMLPDSCLTELGWKTKSESKASLIIDLLNVHEN